MNKKIFLKWSPLNNNKYEKSGREDKMKIIGNNISSLVLDDCNNRQSINMSQENANNYRELYDNKLSQRQWTMQKNLNPFLENNYMKDLKNQEDFMTPKNSHNIKN
tara:strand:+ start:759 stop:1076 length:318 start_codon:yes stop_codon:yes gene_type:complete